ncbi:MAG: hypothetical protein ACP5M0_06575 [Desulfomonilaceae bacterium]
MSAIYVHEIAQEIRSIGARYEFDAEAILEWNGRPILYAVGNAVVDASCCGFWGCRYCVVAGYVVRYKFDADAHGNPLSEVIPIADTSLKQQITDALKEKEGASQVIFL